jgi:hypothetical protein
VDLYLAAALIFAIIGVLALRNARAGAFLFVAALLAVPSSLAFQEFTYRYGLYAYEYFFIPLLAIYPLGAALRSRAPHKLELAALAVVLSAGLIGFELHDRPIDKYALRDLRPVLFVAEALAFFALIERARRVPSSTRTGLMLGLAAAASAFFGFALVAGGVYRPQDAFYEENSFRSIAVGTYGALIVLIWLSSLGPRPFVRMRLLWLTTIAAASAAVLLSGARVVVVATAVACLVAGRLRARRLIVLSVIGAAGIAAFLAISMRLEVSRVTEASTLEGIRAQFLIRYGPAVDVMGGMRWWEWVVGKGVGTTFEIPWFEYRGKDTRNNFIDSAYLTLAVKFGIAGILYLLVFVRAVGVGTLPPGTSRGVLVLLSVLAFTMAIPYQGFAIGLPVFCACLSRIQPQASAAPETSPPQVPGGLGRSITAWGRPRGLAPRALPRAETP